MYDIFLDYINARLVTFICCYCRKPFINCKNDFKTCLAKSFGKSASTAEKIRHSHVEFPFTNI